MRYLYLLLLTIAFSIGTVQSRSLIEVDPIENKSYRNIVIEKDVFNTPNYTDLNLGTIPLDFFNPVFLNEKHNDIDKEKVDKYKELTTDQECRYLYSNFENIYLVFLAAFPIIAAEITFTKGP